MVPEDCSAPVADRPDPPAGLTSPLPVRDPGRTDLSVFRTGPAGHTEPGRHGPRRGRWLVRPGAGPLVVALALAGCSGAATRSAAPVGVGSGPLGTVCPSTVVVQESWLEEATHGGLVQLLLGGRYPRYSVDGKRKLVRGPLISEGRDTGVQLELRAGGTPVFGAAAQPVSALMATDASITLGQQATDEQVLGAATGQPTVAVFAPFQVDPVVMIWDKTRHPDWHSISDIGQTNETVFTFEDANTDFLTGTGVLRPGQVNYSYDGSPAAFMAHPDAAVGGFSINEPYIYRSLGRQVDYAYVTNANFPNYRNTLTVRRADLDRLRPCLTRLVPILQRGMVEFMANPEPALAAIVALDKAYASTFPYPIAQARYGVQVMREDGLVANGPGRVFGAFDPARLTKMIDTLRPMFAARRPAQTVPADLTADTIATGAYLNSGIRLPTG